MQDSLVRAHYEKFPYPKLSLLARVKTADSFLLNYQANVSAAFGSADFATETPRILVVGAGTFEPYIAALANPRAEIIAVDFSQAALKQLQWRLRLHGLSRRVNLLCMDLLDLNESHGSFAMIVATGVLHHLPNPAQGLDVLAKRLGPFGVLRTMLYSRMGRSHIYRIRAFAAAFGLQHGGQLKALIDSLPPDHPLRIHFYLYTDASHEVGIQDGFFVAEDHPFDAWECSDWLNQSGLVATKYLHSSGGLPQDFDQLAREMEQTPKNINDWEKVGVLDRLGQLESNFFFLALKRQELDYSKELEPPHFLIGNPVLRKNCPPKIYAKLLRKFIPVGPKMRSLLEKGMQEADALEAFGSANLSEWESALVLVRERAKR